MSVSGNGAVEPAFADWVEIKDYSVPRYAAPGDTVTGSVTIVGRRDPFFSGTTDSFVVVKANGDRQRLPASGEVKLQKDEEWTVQFDFVAPSTEGVTVTVDIEAHEMDPTFGDQIHDRAVAQVRVVGSGGEGQARVLDFFRDHGKLMAAGAAVGTVATAAQPGGLDAKMGAGLGAAGGTGLSLASQSTQEALAGIDWRPIAAGAGVLFGAAILLNTTGAARLLRGGVGVAESGARVATGRV